MPEFIVLKTGHGGRDAGCDYTIGCNMTWDFITAKSMKDAIKKVMGEHPKNMTEEEITDEDFMCHGYGVWTRLATDEEFSYSDVQIIQISKRVDLEDLSMEYMQAYQDRLAMAQNKQKTKAERAEYERLKKKFENNDE